MFAASHYVTAIAIGKIYLFYGTIFRQKVESILGQESPGLARACALEHSMEDMQRIDGFQPNEKLPPLDTSGYDNMISRV
jgi:hypothetical protein